VKASPSASVRTVNLSFMLSGVLACLLPRTVAPEHVDEELEFMQSLPGVQDTVVFERDRQELGRPNRET
jgi:hypothetical protein